MWASILWLIALTATISAQQEPNLLTALNSSSNLSSFYSLLSTHPNVVSRVSNRQNITILAPNNAALSTFTDSRGDLIDDDVDAILVYHMLQGTFQNFSAVTHFIPTSLEPGAHAKVTGGQRVQLNNATATSGFKQVSDVSSQPIAFTGGFIHIVDKVLTVPTNWSSNLRAFNLTASLGAGRLFNVIDRIESGPELTAFVPNNKAWARIASIIPTLSVSQLENIFAYHIVNRTTLYSTDLKNRTYTTVTGQNVTVTKYNENTIFVNQARIILADILCADGVIHVIDNVLNPNNQTAKSSNNTAGDTAYAGAVSAASISYTEGIAGPTSSINIASIEATATVSPTMSESSSPSNGAAWLSRPTGIAQAMIAGGLALALM